MKLEGKVALVTGAGRNIGRAIALAMADNGASVAVNGLRNQESIDEVARLIEAKGGKALPILTDVSNPTQVNKMVEKVANTLGPVDILVSNVGIRPHGPIHKVSVAEWRTVMSVNLDAAFYLSKAVLPDMIKAENGSLIAIAGLAAFGVRKDAVAVAAAKAGLIGLMRGIAFDFGQIGIRANVVSPGSINTDRYDQRAYITGNATRAVKDDQRRRQGIPMQRMGTPEEVAAACVFLSSADAGYTTGQTLHVGGGVYME